MLGGEPASSAKLFQLQFYGRVGLVFFTDVVLTFADGANEGDDLSGSFFGHFLTPFSRSGRVAWRGLNFNRKLGVGEGEKTEAGELSRVSESASGFGRIFVFPAARGFACCLSGRLVLGRGEQF